METKEPLDIFSHKRNKTDAEMFVQPNVSDDDGLDNNPDDNRAVETTPEATISNVHQNYVKEAGDADVFIRSEVAATTLVEVTTTIHDDGQMSSPPSITDVVVETVPGRENVTNSLQKIIPKVIRFNNRALPKDADTYQLETFEKNAMIIFNQEYFDDYERREGTQQDLDAAKDTFSKFGFEIEPYTDLGTDDVLKELERFSKQDFTDYGCVAVMILTHGLSRGGLMGKDRIYNESEVINSFRIRDNPSLITKPVVIIIQACRGEKKSRAKSTKLQQSVIIIEDNDDVDIQPYTLPVESDMLLLHSTVPGNVSIRDKVRGSWLIQTLCEKINELAATEDLESIMTTVRRAISCAEAVLKGVIVKQMPVMTSTLIRKLYLRKYQSCVSKSIQVSSNIDNSELINQNVAEPTGAASSDRFVSFNDIKEVLCRFVEDPRNTDIAEFAKAAMSKIMLEQLEKNAKEFPRE